MSIRSFVLPNPCLFSSNFISLVWPVWNPVPARSGLRPVYCEVSCSQVSLSLSNHRTGTFSLPALQQLLHTMSATGRGHFTRWWIHSTSTEPPLFFIPSSHPTMGQSLFSVSWQVSETPSLNLDHFPQFPNHTSFPTHMPSPNILQRRLKEHWIFPFLQHVHRWIPARSPSSVGLTFASVLTALPGFYCNDCLLLGVSWSFLLAKLLLLGTQTEAPEHFVCGTEDWAQEPEVPHGSTLSLSPLLTV